MPTPKRTDQILQKIESLQITLSELTELRREERNELVALRERVRELEMQADPFHDGLPLGDTLDHGQDHAA